MVFKSERVTHFCSKMAKKQGETRFPSSLASLLLILVVSLALVLLFSVRNVPFSTLQYEMREQQEEAFNAFVGSKASQRVNRR